jgi:hypothetical protein
LDNLNIHILDHGVLYSKNANGVYEGSIEPTTISVEEDLSAFVDV